MPVNELLGFEREFLDHLRHNTKVLETIAQTGDFDADTQQATKDALAQFRTQWVSGGGESLVSGDQARVIRQREAVADLWRTEQL